MCKIQLTNVAEQRLRDAGWYPGRNVFDSLKLSNHKDLFDESIKILGEFGLLEVTFKGRSRDEKEILYFDVDESEKSKNLRARAFGYDNYSEKTLKDDPDFLETEDYELIDIIKKKINQPCARIAFKEDALGFEIFVGKDGSIYIAHHDEPEKYANSFYEYLNKIILG